MYVLTPAPAGRARTTYCFVLVGCPDDAGTGRRRVRHRRHDQHRGGEHPRGQRRPPTRRTARSHLSACGRPKSPLLGDRNVVAFDMTGTIAMRKAPKYSGPLATPIDLRKLPLEGDLFELL